MKYFPLALCIFACALALTAPLKAHAAALTTSSPAKPAAAVESFHKSSPAEQIKTEDEAITTASESPRSRIARIKMWFKKNRKWVVPTSVGTVIVIIILLWPKRWRTKMAMLMPLLIERGKRAITKGRARARIPLSKTM